MISGVLAGLPGRPDSPFAKLQDNPAWAKHRQELDTAWTKILNERLPVMSAFQKAEFSRAPATTAPVFYPFSGPDSLAVTVFFPQSPVYVMVGLEPAGTLPSPKQFETKNLRELPGGDAIHGGLGVGKEFLHHSPDG